LSEKVDECTPLVPGLVVQANHLSHPGVVSGDGGRGEAGPGKALQVDPIKPELKPRLDVSA